jgi:hypothetical protein
MPADFVFATDQPNLAFTGLVTVTAAAAYDGAVPTATAPAATTQGHLLSTGALGNKASLMHLVPVAGAGSAPTSSNFTGGGLRVVGWQEYIQSSGTPIYVPKVLADVALVFPSSGTASLSVNGTTTYWFNTATVASGVPLVSAYSPGTPSASNVQPAAILVDVVGCRYVTAQYKATTVPTTGSMGVFWATI